LIDDQGEMFDEFDVADEIWKGLELWGEPGAI
jgi:hypothetical protein